MKVLTNTSSTPYGGIARRVSEMVADTHHKSGVEIIVLGIGREKQTRRRIDAGFHDVPLPDSIPKNVYANLDSHEGLLDRLEPIVNTIEKVIKKEKPDVALIEGTYYAPWCIYQASKRANLPIVLLYAGILREEIANWQGKLKEVAMRMEIDFYDPSTSYIFPSSLTKQKVEKEVFKTNLPKTAVIPNGIALEFFADKLAKEWEGIGWVGRATYVKRPNYLLQLAEGLRKLGMNYKIYMVTDARTEMHAEFTRAGIEVIPPMQTKQLRRFYQKRSVIISPSHFETYGNVPMEALAAGTPSLVSDKMGVAERFAELGLEECITNFDDMPETIHKIEIAQTRRIPKEFIERLKRFTWSAIIEEYYKICRQAIEDKTR